MALRFPRLSTRSKLRAARLLYRVVRAARAALGEHGPEVVCRRHGIRWHLDLREGIDLSIYLFGAFERKTSRTLARELAPGSVGLDLGANIGAHALPMSRRVGPGGMIYAFEATEWAYLRLARNLSLNSGLADSLKVEHVVLSDGKTHLPEEIYSSWNVLEFDQPGRPVHGGTARHVGAARRLSLDEYFATVPLMRMDLLKLDVDGFEPLVLDGATALLRRFRPRILLELCPNALEERGTSLEDLLERLLDLGYSLLSEDRKAVLPTRSVAQLSALIPLGGGINALAVPPQA